MNIAIDASSTVDGGSRTHLVEVLRNISKDTLLSIDRIFVFSNNETLDLIDQNSKIIKYNNYFLESNFLVKKIWINIFLKKKLLKLDCDILLDLSGTYIGGFSPYVGMSRNMLIFESVEVNRFNSFFQKSRFFVLRIMQKHSFNRSTGIIFISNYAKNIILKQLRPNLNWTVIHHGVSEKFKKKSHYPLHSDSYNTNKRFQLLYVSNLLPFKHQLNVIKSVYELNLSNIPIQLILIGGYSDTKYGQKVLNSLKSDMGNFVEYRGRVDYKEISSVYYSCDAFIFASTCENMPNILIEAMSSGLPVICSSYGPMPEFGKNMVEYFDPTSIKSIKNAIYKVFSDYEMRFKMSEGSQLITSSFTWNKCSDELFQFLNYCIINKN
jgi:glycosyltransferase involved in cell wall biosynthesis